MNHIHSLLKNNESYFRANLMELAQETLRIRGMEDSNMKAGPIDYIFAALTALTVTICVGCILLM